MVELKTLPNTTESPGDERPPTVSSGVSCVASSIKEGDVEQNFMIAAMLKLLELSEKYDGLLRQIFRLKLKIHTLLNGSKEVIRGYIE